MGKPLSMDLRSRVLAAVDEDELPGCGTAFRGGGSDGDRWHDQRRSKVAMRPRHRVATRGRGGSKRTST